MQTKIGHARPAIALGILFILAGCSTKVSDSDVPLTAGSTSGAKQEAQSAPPARVTERPGNTMGCVFITQYHHIRAGRGDMFRTVKQFKADLQKFYDMGFRPVLASEYLANKMVLPPGASPIVMTFDDSNPTQFKLMPDGAVDPNCAVGIWQAFAKDHPDFPVHGTFFFLPDHPWGPHREAAKKVKMIQAMGSEIANHTIHHPFLNKLSDAKVEWELGTATERLEALGQPAPHSFALPYGVWPKHKSIFAGFNWKGKRITFTGVFMAGGGPALSPNNPRFKPLHVPRMLAISGEDGTDFYLGRIKAGKYKLYVQP